MVLTVDFSPVFIFYSKLFASGFPNISSSSEYSGKPCHLLEDPHKSKVKCERRKTKPYVKVDEYDCIVVIELSHNGHIQKMKFLR